MVQLADFGGFADIFKRSAGDRDLLSNITSGIKDIRTQNVAAELATPGISEKDRQSAMVRLMTVNPTVGQSVAGAMQRGDARVLAQQQAESEKATKLAAFYSTFPGTKEGQDSLAVQIRKDAQGKLAERDFKAAQKLFDLANMSVGDRKAEITKQTIVGRDVVTSVKFAQENIAKREQKELNIARNLMALPEDQRAEAVFQLEQDALANGDTSLAAQLNRFRRNPAELTPSLQAIVARAEPQKTTTAAPGSALIRGGRVVGQVPGRPARPAVPLSPTGKARSDLRSGFITQEDFDTLKSLKPGGSVKLGPDAITKVGDKFFFAQQTTDSEGNPKTILSEIPGTPVNPRTGLTLAQEESIKAKGAGEKTEAELAAEAAGRPEVITAEQRATGRAGREQEAIKLGVTAAESIPALNRVLSLLDVVETGGLSAAKIAVTNALGVTPANETELQNALLVEVLKQIKPIFGGQPSAQESATLLEINTQFGKSTEGNIRLINKVIALAKERVAIAMTDARIAGDTRAVERMQRGLETILDLEKPGAGVSRGTSAPQPSGGALNKDQQKELKALRKKFNR